MDVDKIAGLEPVLDEEVVQAEVELWAAGEPTRTEPFHLRGDDSFALGRADRMIELMGELRRADRGYADQIALWENARLRVKKAIAFFDQVLGEWALSIRTKERKSVTLAHGTIATRQTNHKVVIVDPDVVLGWARTHDKDAIKVTEEVQISKLDAQVAVFVTGYEATNKATGEIDRQMVDRALLTTEALEAVAKIMPGFVVEPLTELVAVNSKNVPIPGCSVAPVKLSATVTPLEL